MMTTRKSSTPKSVMLSTTDGDLGLVPAAEAASAAKQAAKAEGQEITIRDAVTGETWRPLSQAADHIRDASNTKFGCAN
jgi:hypothetical protein